MMTDHEMIASSFLTAQKDATPLFDFPGTMPETLADAYAIQAQGIALHDDRIAGWKVARVPAAFQSQFNVIRWAGPIFARRLAFATDVSRFPVIDGGIGALEAEIIVRLASDAVTRRSAAWMPKDMPALVETMHIGIEVAGSPYRANSQLGPIAMVSGMGNTMGLIIGPDMPNWAELTADIRCHCEIDGTVVGEKTVAASLDDVFEALAFMANHAEELSRPLKAGQWISTGALTGVHPIQIGQRARADFGPLGVLLCEAQAAEADHA